MKGYQHSPVQHFFVAAAIFSWRRFFEMGQVFMLTKKITFIFELVIKRFKKKKKSLPNFVDNTQNRYTLKKG